MAKKYRVGYKDGSGMEYIILNKTDEPIAATTWGCSCCKHASSQKELNNAKLIADALNGKKRTQRQLRSI